MKEAISSAVVAAASSFTLTAFLVRRQEILPILDIPNARSSHSSPKPRTGGVALFLSATAGLVAARALGAEVPSIHGSAGWILIGAVGFFSLGLLDDIRHLPEMPRLLVQTLLSIGVAMFGVRLEALDLPGLGRWVPSYALSVGLTAFWYTGFINLFNFMDGIDGYAAGEAALVGLFLSIISGSPWPLLISASSMGFLIFNWAPARIFMGDGGSYLLGYLLAVSCVTVSAGSEPAVPFIATAIFLAVFIVDAMATLCRRVVRGEPWMKAHRSHYYQKLTDIGLGHGQVTGLNFAVTPLLGLSGLLYAGGRPEVQWAILAVWAAFFGVLFLWIDSKQKRAGLE